VEAIRQVVEGVVMPDSIASLIDSAKDANVVSGVYDRLVEHYGPSVDVGTIPVEHRTVLLVEYTSGVVLNGGFTSLLGAELPGDPEYQHQLAAYKALGDGPAVAAIRRVFDMFPDRIPPADRHERFLLFARANEAAGGRLNTDFFRAHDGLVRDLAAYIWRHRKAFADLDGRPPKPRQRERLRVDQAGRYSDDLPRWARVAFYARCARAVLPLWDDGWPDGPPERREAVERAIRLAELSAAASAPIGDLKKAHLEAVCAGGAAMVTQLGRHRTEDGPPDPPARDPHLCCSVANAAAHATDPLCNPTDQGSYGYAKDAIQISGRDDLMDQLQDDFRRLRRIVRDGGWSDRTPAPPDVFDPDYERPRKPWWKLW
jgi:Domain of unknown function (DUF4375)